MHTQRMPPVTWEEADHRERFARQNIINNCKTFTRPQAQARTVRNVFDAVTRLCGGQLGEALAPRHPHESTQMHMRASFGAMIE